MSGYRTVGRSVPRVDARLKVTGKARFTVDMVLPGMLRGKLLRSPYPHARVLEIHTQDALGVPGVRAVLTSANFSGINPYFGLFYKDQPLLATDRVRFQGEPVAAVVAETEQAAEEAISRIRVEYEPLPVISGPEDALDPSSPVLHASSETTDAFPDVNSRPIPGTNICAEFKYERGDVEAGFAEADLIFEHTFTTPAVFHYTMEPPAAVADVSNGRITVYAGTQYPFFMRRLLSEMFGYAESQIRVVVPYVGGGFGGKECLHVIPLAVWLSLHCGQPVRLALTVDEAAQSLMRHPSKVRLRTGVKKDGTLVAREAEVLLDTGAYADQGPRVVRKAGYRSIGPYRIPNVRVRAMALYTNKPPATAFRGFGTPQVAWAYESQMDIIANALGMDPVELRLKNLLRRGELYTEGNRPLDTDFDRSLLRAVTWLREPGATSFQGGVEPEGSWRRGVGFATALKDGGGTNTVSRAIVRLHVDGSATLLVGTVEMGQGSHTALAQVVAEILGLDLDKVAVAPLDTGVVPYDQRTSASRSVAVTGTAVQAAAEAVVRELKTAAAQLLGDPSLDLNLLQVKDGYVVAGERRVSFQEIVKSAVGGRGSEIIGVGFSRKNDSGGPLGAQTAFWEPGVSGAEIAVDEETGAIRVLRFITIADVGKAINPLACHGQEEGGVVMGLGYTLSECLHFEHGHLVNPNLIDYRVPLASDVPSVLHTELVEQQDGPGPFGAKGAGESSILGVAPAVGNALAAALGVRLYDLPLSPEKVWKALRRQRSSEAAD